MAAGGRTEAMGGTARSGGLLRSGGGALAFGATAEEPLGVPSKLAAGWKPSASPMIPILANTSNVRIARLLSRPTRMRHRAIARRPNLLSIFPQISGRGFGRPCFPALGASVE